MLKKVKSGLFAYGSGDKSEEGNVFYGIRDVKNLTNN